jgi:Bacterial Ig-like domain
LTANLNFFFSVHPSFEKDGSHQMTKVTYTSPSQTYGFAHAPGYTVQNDAWGVGSLVDGVDYSTSVTFDPSNFQSGVTFSWMFPQNVGGVYAYPHIDYSPAAANVSTTQIANIGSLSATYNVSLSDPSNSTVAFDLWFNSQPNGSWTTTSAEVLIEVAPTSAGTRNEPFTLSGSGFSGASVYVSNQSAAGANWEFIDVKLPVDMMSGTISISDVIKGLIWDGVLSAQNYLADLQLGSEVLGGSGSLQVNSLGYNWTANATMVGTAGNDTFSIANPGGNDVVGDGGVDTVVYTGSYSSFQIKPIGSEILVTENNNISTLDELQGITYIKFSDGVYDTVTGTFVANATALATAAIPNVTEKLISDTGASSSDGITSNDALTGTADPNAVVHFTVDGKAVSATATANASGVWTFTPTGLADGTHTVVASETNAAGNTGTASLTFTLDTTPPTVAIGNETYTGGKATLTGVASEAGDTISVYDGTTLLGTTTSGSGGAWTFTTGTVSNAVHNYTVSATDVAGNVGQGSNDAILATASGATLAGTGNSVLVGVGNKTSFTGAGGGNLLNAGGTGDSFIFKAVTDSTPANPDTIINFDHVHDAIVFSGISGINSSHGVPSFQGQLIGSGNLSLNAHSIAFIETGGNTEVLVNTSSHAETVSAQNTHAANMEIVLAGTHLALTSSDFHLI